MASFVWKGYVHKDDQKEYLNFCSKSWLQKQFAMGKDHLSIQYRRNMTGEFRWVVMEVFRSLEYTEKNQIVLMYVRDINDDYVKQLDVVMRRTTDTVGIVTLNISKNICIASTAQSPTLHLMAGMEHMEDYVRRIGKYLLHDRERKWLNRHFCSSYLLQCFAEGKTALSHEVAVYSEEKKENRMIRGTIEMVKNSVSSEIEGILYFTDVTGSFLAEQINRRLYQKNFEKVLVIETGKQSVIVDTPDKFSAGLYREERYEYETYVQNVLMKHVPKKEQEQFLSFMSLQNIREKLKREERYVFSIHWIGKGGEICLKNY